MCQVDNQDWPSQPLSKFCAQHRATPSRNHLIWSHNHAGLSRAISTPMALYLRVTEVKYLVLNCRGNKDGFHESCLSGSRFPGPCLHWESLEGPCKVLCLYWGPLHIRKALNPIRVFKVSPRWEFQVLRESGWRTFRDPCGFLLRG